MIQGHLQQLFTRDLKKLHQEISSYENEDIIWENHPGMNNSAGNLCLHLVGNLNTYIGAKLGNTGYVRNRDLEFSLKNLPRASLLRDIDQVIIIIQDTLDKLTTDDLHENYPTDTPGEIITRLAYLIHVEAHLNYHLGQINYHRRILTKINQPLP